MIGARADHNRAALGFEDERRAESDVLARRGRARLDEHPVRADLPLDRELAHRVGTVAPDASACQYKP